MQIPSDNSLVLPDDYDLCLDRDDQILATLDDALDLLPSWAREPTSSVRAALLTSWMEMGNFIQAKVGHLLGAIATPRHAEDLWLVEWGDLYHRPKAAGESDGQYRARLLDQGDVVSPAAIKASVDALVAKVSPIAPAYLEPAVDAAFASPLDNEWNAFSQPSSFRLWADYPDNINPTVGAYVVPAMGFNTSPDTGRALFWIVLPGDSVGEPQPYCQLDDGGAPGTQWINLVYDPSFAMPIDSEVCFVFASDTPLLEQVRSTVEPIRGGGVTWMAFGDFGIAGAK